MIGIKIANGEFYSIVEENSNVKKRLVLTTVHDKQRSVQIDLYKSYTHTMVDALYIGSLVMENIKSRPRGEPSIELVIASNRKGEIIADAADLDPSVKGERQTLNVSLKTLDDDPREYEIADFELDRSESPPEGLYEKAEHLEEAEKKRGFPWLAVICIALVLTAIAVAVWLFFFRDGAAEGSAPVPPRTAQEAPAPAPAQTQAAPAAQTPAPAPAQTPPAQVPEAQTPTAQPAQTPPAAPAEAQPPAQESAAQTAEPAQPPAPPPVIQAPETAPAAAELPVSRTRRSPPVAAYKVPATIPKNGAPYRIRWGDTLWDISEAFYRTPWLYPRIARFNNIRNPDYIISGRTIRIPPRN